MSHPGENFQQDSKPVPSGPSKMADPKAAGPSNMADLEMRVEWQDDGFPRLLPEDCESLEGKEHPAGGARGAAPPTNLALSGTAGGGPKKRLLAPSLSLTLARQDSISDQNKHDFSAAALDDALDDTPSLDINLEALETPSDSETETLPDGKHELEWEDELPGMERGGAVGVARSPVALCEGLLELDQVDSRGRRWRNFCISGHQYSVNMSVLEPYLHVLSHGGYHGDGSNAIILFTSCYLPENTIDDYEYVMENLFRYIVGTLDLMVSQNYLLVYLCALAPRNKVPAIKWLQQCYLSIDRRLKKDLKALLVVHPAWYIRALITLVKPFISEKFSRKIHFVHNLQQLSEFIPTDQLQIPHAVLQFDEKLLR